MKLTKTLPVLLAACSFLAFASAHAETASASIKAYFSVSEALASDSLAEAKTAASDLVDKAKAEKQDKIAQYASAVAGSASIEKARENFKALSAEEIKQFGSQPGYFVMTCPMANADWLQSTKEVSNPYMGKQMLRCGSVKEKAGAKTPQAAHTEEADHGCCM